MRSLCRGVSHRTLLQVWQRAPKAQQRPNSVLVQSRNKGYVMLKCPRPQQGATNTVTHLQHHTLDTYRINPLVRKYTQGKEIYTYISHTKRPNTSIRAPNSDANQGRGGHNGAETHFLWYPCNGRYGQRTKLHVVWYNKKQTAAQPQST